MIDCMDSWTEPNRAGPTRDFQISGVDLLTPLVIIIIIIIIIIIHVFINNMCIAVTYSNCLLISDDVKMYRETKSPYVC